MLDSCVDNINDNTVRKINVVDANPIIGNAEFHTLGVTSHT